MINTRKDIEMVVNSNDFQGYVRERGITYLGLFGSFSRGSEESESDIDLLVSFGKPIGLIDAVGVDNDFEKFFGRKVDIVNPKFINKRLKKYILKDKIDILGTLEIESM